MFSGRRLQSNFMVFKSSLRAYYWAQFPAALPLTTIFKTQKMSCLCGSITHTEIHGTHVSLLTQIRGGRRQRGEESRMSDIQDVEASCWGECMLLCVTIIQASKTSLPLSCESSQLLLRIGSCSEKQPTFVFYRFKATPWHVLATLVKARPVLSLHNIKPGY